MYQFELNTLLNLIPPALALSALAYFINFFGKIITDQQPFVDDRRWHIELSGFYFLLNIVFTAAVGFALAGWYKFGLFGWWHFVIFSIISVIGSILYFANSALVSEVYQIELPALFKKITDIKRIVRVLAMIGSNFPIWITSTIIFYFAAQELFSNNLFWKIVISSQVLSILIIIAFNSSLQKTKPKKVSIYFVDHSQPPITDVFLLKVNSDNLRLRDDDKIIILNKNQVEKIEIKI